MKNSINTICLVLLLTVCSLAQESVLHENIVRPYQTDDYINAMKKIKEACTANKVDISWHTFVLEDNSFLHVLPVKGTASLETDLWADLKQKIGQEAFDKLVIEFDASVDSTIMGTTIKMADHSYRDPLNGEGYRMMLFLYPREGKEKETEDLLLEWKKHYVEKKSPITFHTYDTQYGSDHVYVVGYPAKDAADMERKITETHQLLGESESELWKKQMSLTKKYYWKRGWYSPELSHYFSAPN